MILLNFSHPLTTDQVQQIASLTKQCVEKIIDIACHIDNLEPLVPQVIAMIEQVGITFREWQTLPIIVNPPSLNYIALVLFAELHGRMGYFPAILRLRPELDIVPQRFEVAEVINLQKVRELARSER